MSHKIQASESFWLKMAFGHLFSAAFWQDPSPPPPAPFSLALLRNISKASVPDFHPCWIMALQIELLVLSVTKELGLGGGP